MFIEIENVRYDADTIVSYEKKYKGDFAYIELNFDTGNRIMWGLFDEERKADDRIDWLDHVLETISYDG